MIAWCYSCGETSHTLDDYARHERDCPPVICRRHQASQCTCPNKPIHWPWPGGEAAT